MTRRLLHVAFAASSILAGACTDDTISRGRADSGVAIMDASLDAPLALMAGWSFTYQARMTRNPGRTESNSIFNLTVTIDAVGDRGAAGDSTVTVSATGNNMLLQNWDQTAGFDSWVALMGPSDATDQVGAAPVTIDLDDPPRQPVQPGPGQPKAIPTDRIFFLDMRRIDALRTGFANAHSTNGPTTLAPDPPARPDWLFQLKGDDTNITYYPQEREITLSYDSRGFLTTMVETIGDRFDTTTDNGTFTLSLTSPRP